MSKTQEQTLAERCYKDAKKRFGDGWKMVTTEVQEMAIDHEVLHVMLAQTDTGPGTVEFIKGIYQAAHFILGQRNGPRI